MSSQIARIRSYSRAVVVTWTAIILASFLWFCYQQRTTMLEMAKAEARIAIQKDTLYRAWATSHGGVYVPATERTPTNPYLLHIAERDIRTPSGRPLTLMNPAYMTRQVFEMAASERNLVRGHLTSLKPIRPENSPDQWESRALRSFEEGMSEASEVQSIEGERYLRLIRPFVTKEGCLKCHAAQGYRTGDVRGGISVSVPLATYSGAASRMMTGSGALHGFIWLFGTGMVLAGRRALSASVTELQQEVAERRLAQEALQEQAVLLEEEIAERKRAEEGIRASEEKFARAFQLAPLMMTITSLEDGEFLEVNDKFLELTGYAREEAIGKSSQSLGLISPHEREALMGGVPRTGMVGGAEFTMRTRSGQRLRCVYYGVLITVNGQQKLLSLIMDITEHRRLEEQLRHSQKMEAVGVLAGGVAHDFNNILTVISGYCSLMQMDLASADPNRERLEEVMKASDRATSLTRSLLTFSRKSEIKLRPADLNEIVRGVEKFLRMVIREDISLVTRLHDDPLAVVADTGQIEQTIMNLATNARDAMQSGGILHVATGIRHVDAAEIERLGSGVPGEYAVLSVSDSGSGMDEETRSRIFDPFFTTKESGKGTGLGLAIVYGIVLQHNGFITVDSEPGRGTTFRVFLPVAGGEQWVAQEQRGTAWEKGGAETILVVEDDEQVRELVKSVLWQVGYRVITAVDGKDAVDKFTAHRNEIRLVVSDLIMPRMSGKEAVRMMRDITPSVKVLFTSGYTADLLQERVELEAGDELLMKPVTPQSLLSRIRVVLDR